MTAIPDFFHMVWIGGQPPADKLANFARLQALHPQACILHGDDTYATSRTAELLAGRDLPWAVQADFWRVELLLEHGGVYLDADSLVLRPLDAFVGNRAPWIATSVGPSDLSGFVSNAFMGFPSGHPFLAELWERAWLALQAGATHAFQLAGPTQVRRTLTHHSDVEVVREVFRNATAASLRLVQSDPLRFLVKHPETRVLHLSEKSWQ